MSEQISPETGEKTFRKFNAKQGADYAAFRPIYHPSLFKFLLDNHTASGGQLKSLLDVGCGPGTAIRSIAGQFENAVGIDASPGMIETARKLGGTAKSETPIRFESSEAEQLGRDLSPPIEEGSVDLITAATAAHWFDMPAFWHRAAKVLKPGGTVAIWASGSIRVHPDTPNAIAFQGALDRFQDGTVAEYMSPRNKLVNDLYVDLPLPWTMNEPVAEFDEGALVRKEWNTGEKYDDIEKFHVTRPVGLDVWEMVMGTASPVQRWREAHPDKAGTEEDVVKITRRELEIILREAGVEKGKEMLNGGVRGVMLIVKKKK